MAAVAAALSRGSLLAGRKFGRLLPQPGAVCLRLHRHLRAAAAAEAPTPLPTQPAVEPPPVVPYNAEAINYVVVTGTALTDPTLYTLPANQYLAHIRLGLRPRFYRPGLQQQPQGAVSVDTFGVQALQLSQHVRKGAQLQVQGVLREDSWTDKTTGQPRRAVKIIAEHLAFVAPSEHNVVGELTHHDVQATGELHPFEAGPPLPGQDVQPQAQQQQQQRTPRPPRPRVTSSIQQTAFMYEKMNKTLGEIASGRGIKLSTVVTHLLTAAEEGQLTAWGRLASDVQLGPPGSDAWLSVAEVADAVMAVEQESQGVELSRLSVKAVRDKLSAHPSTAPKVSALLAACNDNPALLYGAIKLVIAMISKGVNFSIVDAPPGPPDASLAAAPEATAAPQEQPRF